tara:strand:- start:3149 stop:4084 length:936 start_codon:yes stop_codon:yes gene_type:complete
MNNKATLNPVLTGLAQTFMSETTGFVGPVIAPIFNAGMPSGQYYQWDRENYLDLPSDLARAPGTAYQTLRSSLSDDAFVCSDVGVQIPVDDTERALYASSFSADQAATMRATLAVMTEHERKVQTMLADASIPETDTAGTNFSSATVVAIQTIFRAATESVRLNCGMKPNVCIMSETTMNALLDNPLVVAQILHTVNSGVTTAEIIARVFSLPPITVASSIINGVDEGLTTAPADLWDDSIYLAVANPSQDLQALNFARTFAWNAPGVGGSLSIKSYRDDACSSDFFVSHAFRGQKLTAPKAGYRLLNALS